MGIQTVVSWSIVCGLCFSAGLSHQKISRSLAGYLEAAADQERSAIDVARREHLRGDGHRVTRTAARRGGIEVVLRRTREAD